ncbi:MAG: trimethylamine methyltransferase family protein [Geminicoccaceae bacterium]
MSGEGRRGGREARRAVRTSVAVRSLPALQRRIPNYEVLSPEQIDRIHDCAVGLLETIGIEFREDEALAKWRDAGAAIDGARVRIGRDLLMGLVAKAPERFTLNARNPAQSAEIGGDTMVFGPTYGSPFVRGFDGERRYGTIDDLNNLHKLAYMAPALQNTGSVICEPVDVAIPKRHLHITASAIRHSDKSFMGPVTAPSRAEDAVRMCEIVFGKEFVHDNAVMVGLVNGNSPLVWDATMIGALRVYARSGQALVVAPFTLAGANTPASATATVAELMAEALSAIAYAQLERPGAKMILGSFLAAVSMKSGAPMAGTGELGLMNLMIGQLARRYKLPWRSSGMLTGSKITDAQAGYESAFNMLPIMLAGANYVMHCAGWTEAGLTASYAKFMLDAEQMEMLWKFGHGPRFEDFDEAMATVGEVGPGGHFLGTAHTQANFQNAFFMSDLFDNNSFEQWLADGAKDAATRGLEAARRALDGYSMPALEAGTEQALAEFIARRESELPDTQD